MKRRSIKIDIDWTPKTFWSIIPSINLNIGTGELEFEWLCLGIYVGRLLNNDIKVTAAGKLLSKVVKPPLGVIPKEILMGQEYDTEERLQEISEAIQRYTIVGCIIPQKWLDEYNTLAANK